MATCRESGKEIRGDILTMGWMLLDSEAQLDAYIAAYGEMHIMKCRKAVQNFPFEDLVISRTTQGDVFYIKKFEIYDWGCGQGIGSLTLLQMLKERGMAHGLTRITLIEPSRQALTRARKWCRESANASTGIRTVNRYIPSEDGELWPDIGGGSGIAIHICSNILDVKGVSLRWLARQTVATAAENFYICVGPKYGSPVSRISDFHCLLGAPVCFVDFSQYPCGYTSTTNYPYGIEAKCFSVRPSDKLGLDYKERSVPSGNDEYWSGEECLRGSVSESLTEAYRSLREAADSVGFELYLLPSIGIERPDFILLNRSNGAIVVNVCDKISNFPKIYERVEAIKQALIDTYIKSLKVGTILAPAAYNSVKVGLYFVGIGEAEAEQACNAYYEESVVWWHENGEKGKCPANGTKYIVKLFAEDCMEKLKYISCHFFKNDYYEELKAGILGNWHPYSKGDFSLKLTRRQQYLVENDSLRLRVKGVAGCGKTLTVAYKAVREHLRSGSKVLIVTYNIALIRYIGMRINQVPADFSTDAFEIINYHQFFMSKARRYSKDGIPLGASANANFFEPYLDEIRSNNDQYDTIIVDEVQDYSTAWLDCLQRYFLKENGKFILFGDGDQNIYAREMEVASKMPKVNGFGRNNPWRNMSRKISKRLLNPKIAILATNFARSFGISHRAINIQDDLALERYSIQYWNVGREITFQILAGNIRWILDHYNLFPRDVAVLGQSINLLREIDINFRKLYGIPTMTTFESREEYDQVKSNLPTKGRLELELRAIRRVAKVHFTTDVDAVKFATIQSFKGWEAKSVVLIIQDKPELYGTNGEDAFPLSTLQNIPAHIYTAITRARENLFIINLGNDKYDEFFKTNIRNA